MVVTSYDVYQNWEELYSKYKWTKIFMTFHLLVGGAVKWAWRTGQEFTKYFWFAYFLWIFSSLDGVRRRQAYVAYFNTGPNLVNVIYHSKAISGLVLFCWKIEKIIVTVCLPN